MKRLWNWILGRRRRRAEALLANISLNLESDLEKLSPGQMLHLLQTIKILTKP